MLSYDVRIRDWRWRRIILFQETARSMKDAFNITLIKPDGYPHSLALSEVADYLAFFIRRCGFEVQLTTDSISTDCHNIVLCGHMLSEKSFESMPADTIFFNSEQLADVEGWQFSSGVYRRALDRFYVWDYCLSNLQRINHNRKSQIPLLYCEGLVHRRFARKTGDTLVFCGAWNSRRAWIMQELTDAGIKTKFLTQVYGEERDEILFSSWAMLNLHKYENLDLFEPVRCFYPLINQIPIISEAFDVEPWFRPFQDSMFTIEEGSFVETVRRLYRDRARFRTRSMRHFARFRETDPLPEVRLALATYLESVKAMT